MKRTTVWTVCGLVAALVLGIVLNQAFAQRFRPDPIDPSKHGRYQVVSVEPSEIIVLDTATGDLYSATRADVKPYRELQRARLYGGGSGLEPGPTGGFPGGMPMTAAARPVFQPVLKATMKGPR